MDCPFFGVSGQIPAILPQGFFNTQQSVPAFAIISHKVLPVLDEVFTHLRLDRLGVAVRFQFRRFYEQLQAKGTLLTMRLIFCGEKGRKDVVHGVVSPVDITTTSTSNKESGEDGLPDPSVGARDAPEEASKETNGHQPRTSSGEEQGADEQPVLLHLAFLQQGTTAVAAGTAAVLFATGGASAKDRLRKLDPVFLRLRYLLDNPPSPGGPGLLSKICPCCDGAFVLNLKGAGGLLTNFRGVKMMIAHPLEGASIFHAMATSHFECDVSVEKTFLTFSSSRAEEHQEHDDVLEDMIISSANNRQDKPPSERQSEGQGDSSSKNRSMSAPPSVRSSSSCGQLAMKPSPEARLLLAPAPSQSCCPHNMISCFYTGRRSCCGDSMGPYTLCLDSGFPSG